MDVIHIIADKNLKQLNYLGAGAFGTVHRGVWTKNGHTKVVAMKQIKDVLTKGAGPVENVLNEVKYQFAVRHPNIIPLFGISFSSGKDIIIVMDYVDGVDLATLLHSNTADKPRLRTRHKINLAVDMCSAIAYIHSKGLLHRDIKPSNMMVDRWTGKLYVCDFGISKYLGKADLIGLATQYTNSAGGTVHYMAPECFEQDATGRYRKPTLAADIWSLGVTLYELFAGKHLSDNQLLFQLSKIAKDDKIIRNAMPNLPEPIQTIVRKALDFDHSSRPSARRLLLIFHYIKQKV